MFVTDAVTRSSLPADLYQLGRVLLLRRIPPGGFSPDIGKLPWLLLLYCLFAIALGIALNGRADGAVFIDGAVFVPFGAMAVIAGALKWIDRRQDGGRIWLLLSLLLLALPLAGFIGAKVWPVVARLEIFSSSPDAGFVSWFKGMVPQFIALLPHVWLAVAGTVFVARGNHSDDWRRGLYVPLTPLALLAVLTSVDPLALWQISAAPHPEDVEGLTVDEKVFYGQPRLLAEHLAGIEAGKAGVREIFFLGVAGSEEGVFMREVITVEQLFKDRYATTGHSMVLINNPAMARKVPFASRESLMQALRRIGERMNGGEDLLFLFLTSHGSADHRFSIKLWPFEFADLMPPVLRKLLDDAGIQHRVVVVSACYSGGFVPDLADANTLVMTASSAARNSFGCGDANELTDFGRAYFGEALKETRSFSEAFERAKVVIGEREAAKGFLPSLPQIAGGEALKDRLEWFAREVPAPAVGTKAAEGKTLSSGSSVLRAGSPLNRRR
ncbi:MAG: C13 family peptidase [Azoarcus sp.]|jgi:hypothetical protein|nr:C13 family peptidase [Azoarcus sp.]